MTNVSGKLNTKYISKRFPVWTGYPVTLILIAAVTALLHALRPVFPLAQFPIPYILVTMLVAYVFGVGPAVLAFFAGLLVFDYSFTSVVYRPPSHPVVHQRLAGITAYLLGASTVAISMVLLSDSKRRIERIAEELRRSQEDLNRAQVVAKIGSWRLDVQHNKLYWSDETYRLFGIPVGTPLTYETFLAKVHPDDREYVDEKWKAALRGEPYDIEHRIIVDDTVRWVHERAELEYGDDGEVKSAFGTVQDITDLKLAEEARVASEANYRAIFNAANDAIFVHDPETGIVLDANQKVMEMYGYSPEEARTLTIQDISSGEPPYTQEEGMQLVRRAMQGEPQIFEWKAKDKNGRIFWVEVNLKKAIIGGQDRVLAVVRDITDRKQTEEALQREQEHKLQFYRQTIMAATDGKLIITERSEIERLAGTSLAVWEIYQPDELRVIRHEIEKVAESLGIAQDRVCELLVASGEAITNAVKHAGGGLVSVHKTDESLMVVVSDKGPGIPALALPEVALRRGYSTTGTLGMGYKIMIQLMDRVYLTT
ncbi:MAG: PAS domain S-box protein, partial [Armatimonadetes bacterium]|nr:PAS domain S-box protein [Armatimonadota bacterium]